MSDCIFLSVFCHRTYILSKGLVVKVGNLVLVYSSSIHKGKPDLTQPVLTFLQIVYSFRDIWGGSFLLGHPV